MVTVPHSPPVQFITLLKERVFDVVTRATTDGSLTAGLSFDSRLSPLFNQSPRCPVASHGANRQRRFAYSRWLAICCGHSHPRNQPDLRAQCERPKWALGDEGRKRRRLKTQLCTSISRLSARTSTSFFSNQTPPPRRSAFSFDPLAHFFAIQIRHFHLSKPCEDLGMTRRVEVRRCSTTAPRKPTMARSSP